MVWEAKQGSSCGWTITWENFSDTKLSFASTLKGTLKEMISNILLDLISFHLSLGTDQGKCQQGKKSISTCVWTFLRGLDCLHIVLWSFSEAPPPSDTAIRSPHSHLQAAQPQPSQPVLTEETFHPLDHFCGPSLDVLWICCAFCRKG